LSFAISFPYFFCHRGHNYFFILSHRGHIAAFGRNQKKIKFGSCESGELFFASAFLFAASPSYEGGEKRTTAKNKETQYPPTKPVL